MTCDIRNHGNSGAANGGLSGIGNWEWRDCVGGNSQYRAIKERPELLANAKCMVSPMVVFMAAIFDAFSELQGIHQYQELIDLELMKMGTFTAAEMMPHVTAPFVKMPTLIVQVKDDAWTRNPKDGQKTFDLLGNKEKNIYWIEGATRRFKDGHNWFGRHPEYMLDFLAK